MCSNLVYVCLVYGLFVHFISCWHHGLADFNFSRYLDSVAVSVFCVCVVEVYNLIVLSFYDLNTSSLMVNC